MPNEVILVTGDTVGSPDAALGGILMEIFLRNLGDREDLPEYIILWNAAVKTAREGTQTVDHLKRLQERGVKIISCRTCVDYFGLDGKIAAGEVQGMASILDILSNHQVLTV